MITIKKHTELDKSQEYHLTKDQHISVTTAATIFKKGLMSPQQFSRMFPQEVPEAANSVGTLGQWALDENFYYEVVAENTWARLSLIDWEESSYSSLSSMSSDSTDISWSSLSSSSSYSSTSSSSQSSSSSSSSSSLSSSSSSSTSSVNSSSSSSNSSSSQSSSSSSQSSSSSSSSYSSASSSSTEARSTTSSDSSTEVMTSSSSSSSTEIMTSSSSSSKSSSSTEALTSSSSSTMNEELLVEGQYIFTSGHLNAVADDPETGGVFLGGSMAGYTDTSSDNISALKELNEYKYTSATEQIDTFAVLDGEVKGSILLSDTEFICYGAFNTVNGEPIRVFKHNTETKLIMSIVIDTPLFAGKTISDFVILENGNYLMAIGNNAYHLEPQGRGVARTTLLKSSVSKIIVDEERDQAILLGGIGRASKLDLTDFSITVIRNGKNDGEIRATTIVDSFLYISLYNVPAKNKWGYDLYINGYNLNGAYSQYANLLPCPDDSTSKTFGPNSSCLVKMDLETLELDNDFGLDNKFYGAINAMISNDTYTYCVGTFSYKDRSSLMRFANTSIGTPNGWREDADYISINDNCRSISFVKRGIIIGGDFRTFKTDSEEVLNHCSDRAGVETTSVSSASFVTKTGEIYNFCNTKQHKASDKNLIYVENEAIKYKKNKSLPTITALYLTPTYMYIGVSDYDEPLRVLNRVTDTFVEMPFQLQGSIAKIFEWQGNVILIGNLDYYLSMPIPNNLVVLRSDDTFIRDKNHWLSFAETSGDRVTDYLIKDNRLYLLGEGYVSCYNTNGVFQFKTTSQIPRYFTTGLFLNNNDDVMVLGRTLGYNSSNPIRVFIIDKDTGDITSRELPECIIETVRYDSDHKKYPMNSLETKEGILIADRLGHMQLYDKELTTLIQTHIAKDSPVSDYYKRGSYTSLFSKDGGNDSSNYYISSPFNYEDIGGMDLGKIKEGSVRNSSSSSSQSDLSIDISSSSVISDNTSSSSQSSSSESSESSSMVNNTSSLSSESSSQIKSTSSSSSSQARLSSWSSDSSSSLDSELSYGDDGLRMQKSAAQVISLGPYEISLILDPITNYTMFMPNEDENTTTVFTTGARGKTTYYNLKRDFFVDKAAGVSIKDGKLSLFLRGITKAKGPDVSCNYYRGGTIQDSSHRTLISNSEKWVAVYRSYHANHRYDDRYRIIILDVKKAEYNTFSMEGVDFYKQYPNKTPRYPYITDAQGNYVILDDTRYVTYTDGTFWDLRTYTACAEPAHWIEANVTYENSYKPLATLPSHAASTRKMMYQYLDNRIELQDLPATGVLFNLAKDYWADFDVDISLDNIDLFDRVPYPEGWSNYSSLLRFKQDYVSILDMSSSSIYFELILDSRAINNDTEVISPDSSINNNLDSLSVSKTEVNKGFSPFQIFKYTKATATIAPATPEEITELLQKPHAAYLTNHGKVSNTVTTIHWVIHYFSSPLFIRRFDLPISKLLYKNDHGVAVIFSSTYYSGEHGSSYAYERYKIFTPDRTTMLESSSSYQADETSESSGSNNSSSSSWSSASSSSSSTLADNTSSSYSSIINNSKGPALRITVTFENAPERYDYRNRDTVEVFGKTWTNGECAEVVPDVWNINAEKTLYNWEADLRKVGARRLNDSFNSVMFKIKRNGVGDSYTNLSYFDTINLYVDSYTIRMTDKDMHVQSSSADTTTTTFPCVKTTIDGGHYKGICHSTYTYPAEVSYMYGRVKGYIYATLTGYEEVMLTMSPGSTQLTMELSDTYGRRYSWTDDDNYSRVVRTYTARRPNRYKINNSHTSSVVTYHYGITTSVMTTIPFDTTFYSLEVSSGEYDESDLRSLVMNNLKSNYTILSNSYVTGYGDTRMKENAQGYIDDWRDMASSLRSYNYIATSRDRNDGERSDNFQGMMVDDMEFTADLTGHFSITQKGKDTGITVYWERIEYRGPAGAPAQLADQEMFMSSSSSSSSESSQSSNNSSLSTTSESSQSSVNSSSSQSSVNSSSSESSSSSHGVSTSTWSYISFTSESSQSSVNSSSSQSSVNSSSSQSSLNSSSSSSSESSQSSVNSSSSQSSVNSSSSWSSLNSSSSSSSLNSSSSNSSSLNSKSSQSSSSVNSSSSTELLQYSSSSSELSSSSVVALSSSSSGLSDNNITSSSDPSSLSSISSDLSGVVIELTSESSLGIGGNGWEDAANLIAGEKVFAQIDPASEEDWFRLASDRGNNSHFKIVMEDIDNMGLDFILVVMCRTTDNQLHSVTIVDDTSDGIMPYIDNYYRQWGKLGPAHDWYFKVLIYSPTDTGRYSIYYNNIGYEYLKNNINLYDSSINIQEEGSIVFPANVNKVQYTKVNDYGLFLIAKENLPHIQILDVTKDNIYSKVGSDIINSYYGKSIGNYYMIRMYRNYYLSTKVSSPEIEIKAVYVKEDAHALIHIQNGLDYLNEELPITYPVHEEGWYYLTYSSNSQADVTFNSSVSATPLTIEHNGTFFEYDIKRGPTNVADQNKDKWLGSRGPSLNLKDGGQGYYLPNYAFMFIIHSTDATEFSFKSDSNLLALFYPKDVTRTLTIAKWNWSYWSGSSNPSTRAGTLNIQAGVSEYYIKNYGSSRGSMSGFLDIYSTDTIPGMVVESWEYDVNIDGELIQSSSNRLIEVESDRYWVSTSSNKNTPMPSLGSMGLVYKITIPNPEDHIDKQLKYYIRSVSSALPGRVFDNGALEFDSAGKCLINITGRSGVENRYMLKYISIAGYLIEGAHTYFDSGTTTTTRTSGLYKYTGHYLTGTALVWKDRWSQMKSTSNIRTITEFDFSVGQYNMRYATNTGYKKYPGVDKLLIDKNAAYRLENTSYEPYFRIELRDEEGNVLLNLGSKQSAEIELLDRKTYYLVTGIVGNASNAAEGYDNVGFIKGDVYWQYRINHLEATYMFYEIDTWTEEQLNSSSSSSEVMSTSGI